MPSLVIQSTCSAVGATRELVMVPECMISGLLFFKGDIPGEKKHFGVLRKNSAEMHVTVNTS